MKTLPLNWKACLFAAMVVIAAVLGCDSSSSEDEGKDAGGGAGQGDTGGGPADTGGPADSGGGAGDGGTNKEVRIVSDDGKATLTIPEGALPAGVTADQISIKALTADDFGPITGATFLFGYELLPDGLVFNSPVTLSHAMALEGGWVFCSLIGSEAAEPLDVTVEQNQETGILEKASMSLTHFSVTAGLGVASDDTIALVGDNPGKVPVGASFGITLKITPDFTGELTLTMKDGGIIHATWDTDTWENEGMFDAKGPITPAGFVKNPTGIVSHDGEAFTFINQTFRCDGEGGFTTQYGASVRRRGDFTYTPKGAIEPEPMGAGAINRISITITGECVEPDAGFDDGGGPDGGGSEDAGGSADGGTVMKKLLVVGFSEYVAKAAAYLLGSLTPVPGSPFTTSSTYTHSAITPDNRHLYAVGYSQHIDGWSIDQTTGAIAQLSGFPTASVVRRKVGVSPDGKYLYATDTKGQANLAAFAIDDASGALAPVPGSPLTIDAYLAEPVATPGGAHLYVPGGDAAGNGLLHAFAVDAVTGALSSLAVPTYPTGSGQAAIDPAGKHLYVGSKNGIEAFAIDPATGALAALAGSPFSNVNSYTLQMHPSGTYVLAGNPCYITGSDTVRIYKRDPGSGALTEHNRVTLALGTGFESLTRDGQYLLMRDADQPGDYLGVYSFDTATGQATALAGSPYVMDIYAVMTLSTAVLPGP
ncbi:MAG: beta-propeller fold lactonase family protein [Deltaproteobacteria bacterium]|nr:beta-propeller fold lactonase family protein [Deltaproteobacteria bacterium]